MFSKILSGVGNAVGGLVKGAGDLGSKLYDISPAGFASNMLGVDTNPFKAMGFNQQGGGGFDNATNFVRENFNATMNPNAGRQMPQNFGQQQGFGISQALSGNMSPMQLQGMNNMQPYQPTMTNPQYPEQEFITGNPMLYR